MIPFMVDTSNVADVKDLLAELTPGMPLLVVVSEANGSAGGLIKATGTGDRVHARVDCGVTFKSVMGRVADELNLDDFAGGLLVIEDAQWADASSMGRLQRWARESDLPLALIVAHRTLGDIERWWVDRLASRFAKFGKVEMVEMSLMMKCRTPRPCRATVPIL